MLHGFKEAHILAVVNKGQNERKKNNFQKKKKKPRRKYCNIVSKMQGGIQFRKMKNPTTKNNPDSFLDVALS